MKKTSNRLLFVLFAIIISTMVFGFFIQRAAAEPAEQQLLVDKARVTFESFMKDKDHLWLRENLNQAKGLIIIPNLLKAGFFIGGSGGSGVLIVKDDKTGQWSQPAFYTLGAGSLGIQFGAEAAEIIMMVRTQKAVDKLFTSSFKLGGDTSIAVGPWVQVSNRMSWLIFFPLLEPKALMRVFHWRAQSSRQRTNGMRLITAKQCALSIYL